MNYQYIGLFGLILLCGFFVTISVLLITSYAEIFEHKQFKLVYKLYNHLKSCNFNIKESNLSIDQIDDNWFVFDWNEYKIIFWRENNIPSYWGMFLNEKCVVCQFMGSQIAGNFSKKYYNVVNDCFIRFAELEGQKIVD